MSSKSILLIGVFLIFSSVLLVSGCTSSKKEGEPGPPTATVGAACMGCHGNINMAMIVYPAAGPPETIPLYVDIAAYSASAHGQVECLSCHVGMNPTPPHYAPRVYGSWSLFSADDPNVDPLDTKTRNYFVVPGYACLSCHTDVRYSAFMQSDHATDKDRAFLWDGSPRVAVDSGIPDPSNPGQNFFYNETYNAVDCGSCHLNNNCGTCHWKSAIVSQWTDTGSAADDSLWTDYTTSATDIKAQMTTKWLDWTVNIASHNFLGKADLTTSNEVCTACHAGFYDAPDSGTVSDLSITGTVIEGHPQAEEMLRSAKQGVHTTKQFCTDCHTNIHMTSASQYQTKSNGWAGDTVQCTDCHADKVITGTRHNTSTDITCIGCHDAELTVTRDLSTNMVVPETVDVNLEKSWPSHNLIKGQDIKCGTKCHFPGNPVGAPISFPTVSIHE